MEELTQEFETWLNNLLIADERHEIINNLQEKMNRTLFRLQTEGLVQILEFERIKYIAQSWLTLIELLSTNEKKEEIIKLALILYELGQIDINLFTSIVIFDKL